MEYTYDTEVMEIKGDDNVVALMLQTFETRTQTDVYIYPSTREKHTGFSVQRESEEVDTQRRLLDVHKVVVTREHQPRYHCSTKQCGECSGCKTWGMVIPVRDSDG